MDFLDILSAVLVVAILWCFWSARPRGPRPKRGAA
jgi:hypothetical protein